MITPSRDLLFDLSGYSPCTLDGAAMLAALCENSIEGTYGPAPLGRYNKSVARVLGRVERFARLLRPHLRHRSTAPAPNSETVSSVAEEMESLIYACTEHAESVKGILVGCGISPREKAYRPLFSAWKDATDLLDEMTNTMKHQEARCRFHTVHIRHAGNFVPLHGFFIEGYRENALGPHPVLHRGQPVYSVTWVAWAAIELVLTLSGFMQSSLSEKYGALSIAQSDRAELRAALVEATRLPAYSFGEPHFLSSSRPGFILPGASANRAPTSDPYGSIFHPWALGKSIAVVGSSTMHVADGQTKTFEIVSPDKGALINWKVISRPA